jgi:hypothetical protein
MTVVNIDDTRQLEVLVTRERPDVAVCHLSASCQNLFRLVEALREIPGACDIPLLFVIDAEPHERDAGFLSAGARFLAKRGTLKLRDLGEKLAAAADASGLGG